jgi:hypothetical protein
MWMWHLCHMTTTIRITRLKDFLKSWSGGLVRPHLSATRFRLKDTCMKKCSICSSNIADRISKALFD